jgi:hypothetical protein
VDHSPSDLEECSGHATVGDDRAVAVGVSCSAYSEAAGREAAEIALAGLDAAVPRLVLVFCSSRHDMAAVSRGVAAIAGGGPMIGCTTSGEIAGPGPQSSGVVVSMFGGGGFSVSTAMEEVRDGDLRGAAERAARCVEEVEDRGHTVLLMLSDGLAGDQQEVVRGAYARVGAEVPLVGGCAADDQRMEHTTLLHGTDALEGAIVMAAISSDAPLGIGVGHGWRAAGEPMLVTGSDGVSVCTLDGRPALEVYLDQLDAPPEVYDDPAAFTAFAASHPLGVLRRGRHEIRSVAAADFAAQGLRCFAEVPQGSSCQVMRGDDDSVLSATVDACTQAVEALHGRDPRGLVVFDCSARKELLGDVGTVREIGLVGSVTGTESFAGFYTYGEFARTSGPGGFHNQTLVVLAVA